MNNKGKKLINSVTLIRTNNFIKGHHKKNEKIRKQYLQYNVNDKERGLRIYIKYSYIPV